MESDKRLEGADTLDNAAGILKRKARAKTGQPGRRSTNSIHFEDAEAQPLESSLQAQAERQDELEDRLQKSEEQINKLLGKDNKFTARNLNEEIDDMYRTKNLSDKEISIRRIVEDERKIIEDRFKKDLKLLKDQNQNDLTSIAY